MRRWIGLVLFLEIGRMRCVSGLDCSGFGAEIWICGFVPGGRWRRDGGRSWAVHKVRFGWRERERYAGGPRTRDGGFGFRRLFGVGEFVFG